MHQTLKSYQKRLSNLTAKNRSLFLLKKGEKFFSDIHDWNFIDSKPAFGYISDIISQKSKIRICDKVDGRHAAANKASLHLLNIFRAEKTVRDECGAQDLYVGYPFVEGRLIDDSPVRCPLLFFPISLSEEGGAWYIAPRKDAGITFNKSFLLAYSFYNGLVFEEDFLDYSFEDFPKDQQEFMTALYLLLDNSPLKLNFNRENFEDALQHFPDWKRDDFEGQTKTGALILKPQALLGLFPQADSFLMPDYTALLASPMSENMEAFLGKPGGGFLESDVLPDACKEENIFAPYPVDASQEKALLELKAGKSIVVQGPPGSGKSQLICNLIADYMARGKRVLVVCQKRAALDVVYQRLKEKDLHRFSALVHDFKNDRKDIYEQMSKQIDFVESYERENNELGTGFLQDGFMAACREIENNCEELDGFRKALFDTSECGVSVKELYLSSSLQADKIELREEYQYFTMAESRKFLQKTNAYSDYAARLEENGYVWGNRVSFAAFGLNDLRSTQDVLKTIPVFTKKIRQDAARIAAMPEGDLEVFEGLNAKAINFKKISELLDSPETYNCFINSLSDDTEPTWLQSQKESFLACFEEDGVEVGLKPAEIPAFHGILLTSIKSQEQFFTKIGWWFSFEEKKSIAQRLLENGLTQEAGMAERLLEKIKKRIVFERLRSDLALRNWPGHLPDSLDKKAWEAWFDLGLRAIQTKKLWLDLQNLAPFIRLQETGLENFRASIAGLLDCAARFVPAKAGWKKYLTEEQINDAADAKKAERLLDVLERDFDTLCEFDKLKESLGDAEKNAIAKLRESLGQWDKKRLCALFDNSIRIAWIEHIESKNPVLRAVSSLRLEQTETLLQNAVEAKKQAVEQIVRIKLKEKTYSGLEYNRLQNLVSYRELKHQTNKKKKIWPLRKLIHELSDDVFKIIPCWLASPETVSAIFQMEKNFDLVIFDEASQCFAEKGIPALYRAKQTAIVGDSQQLAPNDLYMPRWENDDDESPDLEVDSLLDLGCQYLPQHTLTGHYRSRSLQLIDFSNQHFYQGKLNMLPHRDHFLQKEPAIEFIRVAGLRENSSNKAEAEKVLELVQALLARGISSIGVIAFNAPQQNLILDLATQLKIFLPENVFVKNIENVQGDERDYIIFSNTYAPAPDGSFKMLFGSLNTIKGENRVNVAVTRAKEKIFVVSSILPEQLKTEGLKHKGPQMWKDYLVYAQKVSDGLHKPTLLAPGHNFGGNLLKHRLLEKTGATTDEKLPFADFLVASGTFPKLVFTDDDLYYRSVSAKEAHAYLPALLKEKNWEALRFYSRPFWKNNEEANKAFLAKVNEEK